MWPMYVTETFTDEEWRTLWFAPFWVFSAVVGRYRGFDPLEFEAFTACVERSAETGRGTLGGAVLNRVGLDMDRLARQYAGDSRSIASGLWQVGKLLARLPDGEAESVREALVVGVGEGVARARGRFGRYIGEDDAKTIELVATLLT
jgi:hypothetical protein